MAPQIKIFRDENGIRLNGDYVGMTDAEVKKLMQLKYNRRKAEEHKNNSPAEREALIATRREKKRGVAKQNSMTEARIMENLGFRELPFKAKCPTCRSIYFSEDPEYTGDQKLPMLFCDPCKVRNKFRVGVEMFY